MRRLISSSLDCGRDRRKLRKYQVGAFRMDPFVFSNQAISDETAQSVAELEALLKDMPQVYDIGAPAMRELRRQGKGLLGMQPPSGIAEWRTARANGLDVPIRVFLPKEIRGVYLHIHGGGHTLGGADLQDQSLEALATTLGAAVVSVEYRLAPEHPWPAGADDCEAAAMWLVDHIRSEFGAERAVIGGESAGAHLAAVALLRLRDKRGTTGFCGANLVYGVYDMSFTPSLRNWGDRRLVINTPVARWFGENLLPPDRFDMDARRDPSISPLFAALRGMPPALFTVGTLDPLLDDSLFMAQRWAQAGAEAELAVWPGGVHAFDILDIAIAREARARMADFVSARLDAPAG